MNLFVARLIGSFSTPLASPVTEVRGSDRVSWCQDNRSTLCSYHCSRKLYRLQATTSYIVTVTTVQFMKVLKESRGVALLFL